MNMLAERPSALSHPISVGVTGLCASKVDRSVNNRPSSAVPKAVSICAGPSLTKSATPSRLPPAKGSFLAVAARRPACPATDGSGRPISSNLASRAPPEIRLALSQFLRVSLVLGPLVMPRQTQPSRRRKKNSTGTGKSFYITGSPRVYQRWAAAGSRFDFLVLVTFSLYPCHTSQSSSIYLQFICR